MRNYLCGLNLQTKKFLEKNMSVSEGKIIWRSPSNIALIKYWGKKPVQLPQNPSISFTLSNALTTMQWEYKLKKNPSTGIELDFIFTDAPETSDKFKTKIQKFLESVLSYFPFLNQYALCIQSSNTFPHSAGIASSASSMSALSLCLCSMENQLLKTPDYTTEKFMRRASHFARLASGSACRSMFSEMGFWGRDKYVKGSSNNYAIGFGGHIAPIFKTYCDAILIVSKAEKKVSSRAGHALLEGNIFAPARYKQARANMKILLEALVSGDVHTVGRICEDEAMTLHALMMTSSPTFTLLHPNTLHITETVKNWRNDTNVPLYFTIDAGPNVHLLYPKPYETRVHLFIEKNLKQYCENGEVIYDHVGQGASLMVNEIVIKD